MFESVQAMLEALNEAIAMSSDVPDLQATALGERISDRSPGRPSVQITAEELAALSTGRMTREDIGSLYNCSARTIRRRLLKFGLSSPGPTVFLEDGTRPYSSGSSSDLSEITDNELDQLILQIKEQFPSFGRRMIDGYLMQLGERVPRARVLASCNRVIGPPTAVFGARRIQRKVYSVPGPNSLWHHDGQHGAVTSFCQLQIW
jgi:hypothetical protein